MISQLHPTDQRWWIHCGRLDFSFDAGDGDAWVIKLDAKGNVQWRKTMVERLW